MTNIRNEACDVLIVGAGPAGLSAAAHLKALGTRSVVVVDRESVAGGVPRLCLHSPFGMREFGRVLAGPSYAARLASRAVDAGVDLRLSTTVVGIDRGDAIVVSLASDEGETRVSAGRVLLATGAREKPRSARLVSGDRPLGVINTGALQGYAARNLLPFRRPLVVGTELVSLSGLLTCRAVGARPVMMIEERDGPLTRWPTMVLPRLLGVPVRYGARILDIRGGSRVEAVTIALSDGKKIDVTCDGVLFTGRFTPEASIAGAAGLELDRATGGPVIDQFGRTSDPRIYAAGNVLRPIETARWCWSEARAIAGFIADDLAGRLPGMDHCASVRVGPGVAYVLPQRLVPGDHPGLGRFQIRVSEYRSGAGRGRLLVQQGEVVDMARRRHLMPERRLLMPITPGMPSAQEIVVEARY